MLKIKLQPNGKKHQRYYRIVVAEAKSKLTGRALDTLGHYNPHLTENKITIDQNNYQLWLERGAQPTPTIKKLLQTS
jgi:small subunit ribosomal protein S16